MLHIVIAVACICVTFR